MFLFQLFCFELRHASHYCTRSSHAQVERVSRASRVHASMNLWVDGTVIQNEIICDLNGLASACCMISGRGKKKTEHFILQDPRKIFYAAIR